MATVEMRPDTNSLSLRITRTILDAARPFRFEAEGTSIDVAVERLPPSPWPASGVEGLIPSTDGPWPSALRLRCTWANGAMDLLMEASYWRGKGRYRHLTGLRARVPAAHREVLWITTGLPLRTAVDGEEVLLEASFVPFGKRGTDVDPLWRSLAAKHLVERAGFALVGEARIEACRVRLPDLAFQPRPEVVFERLAKLAILKVPFFLRDAEGIEGKLPFVPKVELSEATVPPPGVSKRAGIWPLPGGVRSYKDTLDVLLHQIGQEGMPLIEFYGVLKSRYDVTGETSVKGYVSVLTGLEYCTIENEKINLTTVAHEYLRNCDVDALFDRMHAVYLGVLDLLVIADAEGSLETERAGALLKPMLGVTWQTANQVSFRRNWLLSMGLTDRNADGDTVTEHGRRVLGRYADEVEAIRGRLDKVLDEIGTDQDGLEGADDDALAEGAANAAPGLDVTKAKPKGEPSAWSTDRVDLRHEMLEQRAAALVLPANVLASAAAALSAGKHVLLVGPPGTGKTEIAHAIVDAAAAEGYCTGAFVSTASADWTGFDTIGGYALTKDGTLKFRSGALLRAIEQWQWLVIDEINRADVDRAFGELMTVLAGRTSDTAYENEDGRLIRIGPDPNATHPMPKTFRVIAAMNTWDKTSLFRLSYAVQRRFAMIHVGIPEDVQYHDLVRRQAEQEGLDPPLPHEALGRLAELFSRAGLLAARPVGPAVALDIIRYMRRRASGHSELVGEALAEALAMYLLPQLEGLEQGSAVRARDAMMKALDGWTSLEAQADLQARIADVFPHVKWPSG